MPKATLGPCTTPAISRTSQVTERSLILFPCHGHPLHLLCWLPSTCNGGKCSRETQLGTEHSHTRASSDQDSLDHSTSDAPCASGTGVGARGERDSRGAHLRFTWICLLHGPTCLFRHSASFCLPLSDLPLLTSKCPHPRGQQPLISLPESTSLPLSPAPSDQSHSSQHDLLCYINLHTPLFLHRNLGQHLTALGENSQSPGWHP